jgi:lincosamide nucleotidyltransferase A/C/D/E
MVTAEDVVTIYTKLSAHGIKIWLVGGWGIDALLEEQTRPHKDLDVILLLDDVARTRELLENDGYELKELWPENRFVKDGCENETATAFVYHDAEGREFDAHAMVTDEQGNGIPAWADAEDFIFKKEELEGTGLIGGFSVQCITPESQIICHLGYELPEKQKKDLDLLHRKYKIDYPRG